MALPKRRKSHARVRTRRAQWKAAVVSKTTCSHCGTTSVPHRVCTACGYYNGRQILAPRVKNTQLPEQE
jgi:large subunit ribosomal protein L32